MSWQLVIQRLGEQTNSDGKRRTIGAYQLYVHGSPVEDISGYIVEPRGPGDNTVKGKKEHLCIEVGTYDIGFANGGDYSSFKYNKTSTHPKNGKMPGIAILDTGPGRTFIRIHPVHDGGLYLSSVGCLNPVASGENKDGDIADSRDRVIALIDSLKAAYPGNTTTEEALTGAKVIIRDPPA